MDLGRYAQFGVIGKNVRNVLDVFRLFPAMPLQVLSRNGITGSPGKLIEAEWYPLENWLRSLWEIQAMVGTSKLFDVGLQVPKNSPFPPSITDAHSALGALDVAYHMNHVKAGRVMFDPSTGAMLEGIGHYLLAKRHATGADVEVRDVPYPCDLDRGILVTLTKRFQPLATVAHAPGRCRNEGGPSCTFAIRW